MSKHDREQRRTSTTTTGASPSEKLRTQSGREVRAGDTISEDDPLVVPAADGTGAKITIGYGSALVSPKASTPGTVTMQRLDGEPKVWWNNVRRAWLTDGPKGEAVLVDPQPPAPNVSDVGRPAYHDGHGGHTFSRPDVPPAVKVST